MTHKPSERRKMEKVKRYLARRRKNRQGFFDGWMIWANGIIVLCALATHWATTGDSALPKSNWWWMAIPVGLVYGRQAYRYFYQGK